MTGDVPDRDLDIGRFIRLRRTRSHLTQRDLGDLAGVGKRFIVELEGAKPTLRMDKVNQVLAVFGWRLGAIEAGHEGTAPAERSLVTPFVDRKDGSR